MYIQTPRTPCGTRCKKELEAYNAKKAEEEEEDEEEEDDDDEEEDEDESD